MAKKCPRCGARWKEDPSCGKVIHLELPPKAEKLKGETKMVIEKVGMIGPEGLAYVSDCIYSTFRQLGLPNVRVIPLGDTNASFIARDLR